MKALLVAMIVVAFAVPASADTGIGVRMGATLSPDQFHFGGHLDLGPVAKDVRLHPNVEIGIGDNLTVIALGVEALYIIPTNWGRWHPYAGGGIAIAHYDFDGGRFGRGGSDSEFGITMSGGIERALSSGNRFFVEMKIGALDVPDLKFTVGWTFPV